MALTALTRRVSSVLLRASSGDAAGCGRQRRAVGVALALSFLLFSVFPLLRLTSLGTLRGLTDHIRHPHVARVAIERGLAVYTAPFGVAREGIAYPYPADHWLDAAYAYPPGALLVYLPAALLGMTGALSYQGYSIAIVLYLLALAHLSIWRVALVAPPVVTLLAWLTLVQQALNGQYDVVWIGAAAVAFERLRDERPESALGWVCVAGLLHFRAVTLAPAGVYALRSGIVARGWPWRSLGLVALTSAICGATFIAMAPYATTDLRPLLTEPASAGLVAAIAFSAIAALLALRVAEPWTAAAIVLVGVLSVTDVPHWWHATLMLPVLLGIGILGRPRRPVAAIVLGLVWYVTMQRVAWHSYPLWLFRDITGYLRG